MKIILIFATLLGLFATVQAQTTVRIDVNGQLYDLTYNSTDFDSILTTWGSDRPEWWETQDFNPTQWTTGLYNANNSLDDIRFVYSNPSIGGTTYALYKEHATANGVYGQTDATANYAISARIVPAPLPILGILPIIGFLKKMRRRQTLS